MNTAEVTTHTSPNGALPVEVEPGDASIFCAEQAEAIRVLGRRVVGDILDIGQRLIAVRERLPHGAWLPWLDRELGWSERAAYNFIAAASAFGKIATNANLQIDAGALYLLAGPSVPQPARDAAIERAEAGDRITKAEAERLVAEAKAAERVGIASTSAQEYMAVAFPNLRHGGNLDMSHQAMRLLARKWPR